MAFFYEEGEEKKRSGVFMRHVNIGTIAEDEDGNGSYAPSRIFIDPSLTQEGEAAEAKATGDAINALAEQTNQALDELSENTETAISDLQDATEEAINSLAAISVIEDTKSGEVVSVADSAAAKLRGLHLYGKSVQDGVPTPDSPVEIESVGDGGNVTTYVFGQNLIDPMDAGKWKISNNATFEILGNGEIKVTGSRGYSGVKYNIPSDTLNLLKGKNCVISRTIDSQTNESAAIIVQLTVNTASGFKYYNAIGSPITIDADTTSATFDVLVNNTSTTLGAPNTVVFSNLGIYFGEATQSWDTYEPMQTLTYPTPNGLPGIPVDSDGNYTDAEGQQWYCDIVDFAAGTHTKYVDYVDLKNYTFTLNSTWTNQNDNLALAYARVKSNGKIVGTLSNKLVYTTWKASPSLYSEYQITVENTGLNQTTIYVILPKTEFSGEIDSRAVNNYLSTAGIYALVPLETPTETDLTPEQLEAYVAHTMYKPNTTVTTDSSPAAGAAVDYVADPKAYIDNKFSALEALQAQVDALIGADSET